MKQPLPYRQCKRKQLKEAGINSPTHIPESQTCASIHRMNLIFLTIWEPVTYTLRLILPINFSLFLLTIPPSFTLQCRPLKISRSHITGQTLLTIPLKVTVRLPVWSSLYHKPHINIGKQVLHYVHQNLWDVVLDNMVVTKIQLLKRKVKLNKLCMPLHFNNPHPLSTYPLSTAHSVPMEDKVTARWLSCSFRALMSS